MTPAFFGPADAQLLGVHHAPRGAARQQGVVLCAPAPMEVARTHWAFRKLAEALSKTGFDVLRFDYRGTGDSAGELADTTAAQWVEDIGRAVTELKELTGHRRVHAIGFRFGAMLLAQAARQGLALESMVLWEPVVNAANWLAQLEQNDQQRYRAFRWAPPRQRDELLGFVIPPALRKSWEAMDLATLGPWSPRTTIVVATQDAHHRRLARTLEERSQMVDWKVVPASESGSGALLGNEALEQMVNTLGGHGR